jgi:hypothetical protein
MSVQLELTGWFQKRAVRKDNPGLASLTKGLMEEYFYGF